LSFKQSNPNLKIELLSNPENQGYGGNQKLGYPSSHTFALKEVHNGEEI
jgi:hypothetical protein